MASSREATNNSSRSVRTTRPSLASGMQDLTLASPDHAPQGWYSDSEDDEKIINKDRMKKPSECVKVSEPHIYTLSFAEQIGVEESFCNLTSLKQYPFDHLGACFRKQILQKYFDNGELFRRQWDFFYIYAPLDVKKTAILLLPTAQVENFLHEIGREFDLTMSLPADTQSFSTLFPMDGTPRPRYLGHSTDRETAEGVKLSVPSNSWRPDNEITTDASPSDRSLAAFRKRMEGLLELDRNKKAAIKLKKANQRHIAQQNWGRQTKRVQRYLGLTESRRGHHDVVTKSLEHSGLQWTEYDNAVKAALEGMTKVETFSYDNPAPFPAEDCVIFISIDVEAYERDHNKITEIGVATLDTADLKNLAPGENGKHWMRAIRCKHYRIYEHKHLVNKDFVAGCPERFQFGNSEFISIKNAPSIIASCFKPPYSNPEGSIHDSKRNIVLVGHDLLTDVDYLRKIGYDVKNLSNRLENIDSSSMYRALRRETNRRNLGSCLADLSLTGWWLHNAGNDAAYSLQAMIAIALTDLNERQAGGLRAKSDEVKEQRREERVRLAKETSIECEQGWSSAEEDDGGEAQARLPNSNRSQKW